MRVYLYIRLVNVCLWPSNRIYIYIYILIAIAIFSLDWIIHTFNAHVKCPKQTTRGEAQSAASFSRRSTQNLRTCMCMYVVWVRECVSASLILFHMLIPILYIQHYNGRSLDLYSFVLPQITFGSVSMWVCERVLAQVLRRRRAPSKRWRKYTHSHGFVSRCVLEL